MIGEIKINADFGTVLELVTKSEFYFFWCYDASFWTQIWKYISSWLN